MHNTPHISLTKNAIKITDWTTGDPVTTIVPLHDIGAYQQHWKLISQNKTIIYPLMKELLHHACSQGNSILIKDALFFITDHLSDVDVVDYQNLYNDIDNTMMFHKSSLTASEYLDVMEKVYLHFHTQVVLKPVHYIEHIASRSIVFQKLALGTTFHLKASPSGDVQYETSDAFMFRKIPASVLKNNNISLFDAIFFETTSESMLPLAHSYLWDNTLSVPEKAFLLTGLIPTFSFDYDAAIFEHLNQVHALGIDQALVELSSHQDDIDGEDYRSAVIHVVECCLKGLIGESGWDAMNTFAIQHNQPTTMVELFKNRMESSYPYTKDDYQKDKEYAKMWCERLQEVWENNGTSFSL